MFFDGKTWVITDTPYKKEGNWITNGCKTPVCEFDTGIPVTGFTAPKEDVNGIYKKTGDTEYGLPVFENENGWKMYYSVEQLSLIHI